MYICKPEINRLVIDQLAAVLILTLIPLFIAYLTDSLFQIFLLFDTSYCNKDMTQNTIK